jgi:acetyl esterase/lipase
MRRAYILAATVLTPLTLVGCGGADGPRTSIPVIEHSVGTGADRTWVVAPARGDPISVVVFLHGLGDQRETTPYYHRPWLDHLARSGSYVLYPRY